MFLACFGRIMFVLECTPSPFGVQIQVGHFPNESANPVTKKAGTEREQKELSGPGNLPGLLFFK
jgi:hypothetical protein